MSVQFERSFLAFHRGVNQFGSSILSKVMAEKSSVHYTHYMQYVIKLEVRRGKHFFFQKKHMYQV